MLSTSNTEIFIGVFSLVVQLLILFQVRRLDK